ncbi:hypothetical protein I312_100153 [Cryptococcus bacillisporus CA1280]|uniref:uncharacterized protein n=1 Tax=Cryptococcus bacillisporus CA1280 TaxID=1296109 RepID=UPI0033683B17
MTTQILPDQISTTTTAPPRRPIWEVLKDEKVNLMERGLQLLVQQTIIESGQPSLQNAFGGTNHPRRGFQSNFSQDQCPWGTTLVSQFTQNNPFTMEDLISHRMMIQTPQAEEDLIGYIPRSHFAHPSVASNGLGGSRNGCSIAKWKTFCRQWPFRHFCSQHDRARDCATT